MTDLSITTVRNETYTFEIHVVADLTQIQGKLRSTFPSTSIKLSQLRDHIVVEGQARDQAQITRIIQTIEAYLTRPSPRARVSSGVDRAPGGWPRRRPGAGGRRWTDAASPPVPAQPGAEAPENQNPPAAATPSPEALPLTQVSDIIPPSRIINLLRVAGSQQVMLKVRIAELNPNGPAARRRQLPGRGYPHTGAIVGSSIAGPTAYQGTIGQPGEPALRQSTLRSSLLVLMTGTRPSSAFSSTTTSTFR